jgi:hypothetical protein
VTLSAAGGWIPSPNEDVFVSLLLNDGSVLNATVVYAGNDGQPFANGDINFDGDVDVADWQAFLVNGYSTLPGLSRAESYALGDFDGDGDNDFSDFRVFKVYYDDANGAGAFAAMSGAAPEPAGGVLAIVAATFLSRVRGRGRA